MAKHVKTKRPCCQGKPRCKRCPVVMLRLAKSGNAQRTGKRSYVLRPIAKHELKAARAR